MANPVGTPAPLRDVVVEISVELGRTRVGLRDLASHLAAGQLIHMGKEAGERVDIFVNGRLVGRGEAVAVGQRHGVRILEILPDGKRAPLRKRSRSLLAAIGGGRAASSEGSAIAQAPPPSDDLGNGQGIAATVRVGKVGYGAAAPASLDGPMIGTDEIAVDAGEAVASANGMDEAAPASLDTTGLMAWAWERASQVELSHPEYQKDSEADGDRFRAAFQQASGLPPDHLRWMSEDVFCILGPIVNSGGEPEYLCYVRAYATDGKSGLFAHFFDRVSSTGRPHSIIEPARIPAEVFDSVEGDVYALFPEQFTKGKVE